MRKFLVMTMLCCLCSAVWNAGRAAIVWTYDADDPIIQDVEQLSANSIQPRDGGGLAALIDHVTSHCHSGYSGEYAIDAYHYLQVDMLQPYQRIYFYMKTRDGNDHDTPNHVRLYVTNTPDDESSWTLVKDFETEAPNAAAAEYVSPMIDFGAEYQYFRMEVITTTGGERRTYTYEGTDHVYSYWNLDEFQMYKARPFSPQETLAILVDSLQTNEVTYPAGTTPGYYPQELVDAYAVAYAKGVDATLGGQLEDDEYVQLYENLVKAMDDLEENVVPIEEGYYYIYSGYEAFGEDLVTFGPTERGVMNWFDFDDTVAAFIYKVSKSDDGNYNVESLSGGYINKYNGTYITFTSAPETPQVFIHLNGSAQYLVSNVVDAANGGCYYGNGYLRDFTEKGTAAAWRLVPVSDDVVAAMQDKAAEEKLEYGTYQSIASAHRAVSRAVAYEKLITDPYQLSGPSSSHEGNLANLIDGSDVYPSIWASPHAGDYAGDIDERGHWIDIALDEAKKDMILTLRRHTFIPWANYYAPVHLLIDATNEAGEEDSYKRVAEFDLQYSIDGWGSHILKLDEPYQFIRVYIQHCEYDDYTQENYGPFTQIGELQLYDLTALNENDKYYGVPGLKEAADKVNDLLVNMYGLVERGGVTGAAIAQLEDATAELNDIYEHYTEMSVELAKLVKEADELYDSLKVYTLETDNPLIYEADDADPEHNQFSSNAKMPDTDYGEWGRYAFLIDEDPSTFFFTIHDPNYGEPEGLHYLQVDLRENPVDVFQFYFARCTEWPAYTWTSMDIYASNDEDADDQQSWVKVATLSGLSADAESYYSPLVKMDEKYQFLRFSVTSTARGRVVGGGESFCVGEFQIYEAKVDEANSDYFKTGMPEAAEGMKGLSKEDAEKRISEITENDITALMNAIAKVKGIKDGTAVKAVRTFEQQLNEVNVYTIDGRLVKQNVKAADAVKGLQKGIYVVGKKKVAVK